MMKRLGAESTETLPTIVDRLRGRACDLRAVALDDQQGRLYLPIVGRPSQGMPGGELVVRRVVEFTVGDIDGLGRFPIDALAYDEPSRQLSIRSGDVERFRVTVERVDVVLSFVA